jgi:hypothetical protein
MLAVLWLNFIQAGEVFVLVDCGGGTTDLGIYQIASKEPLRLECEVEQATGKNTPADITLSLTLAQVTWLALKM